VSPGLALRALALGACLAAASGCDETPDKVTCTLGVCGGGTVEVELVDDDAQAAWARGEYRSRGASSASQPTAFDCSLSADAGRYLPCSGGTLRLDSFTAWPTAVVEVRFVLNDGTWSAWQAIDLEFTEHIEPDFNGPGCSCTWYTATAAPIVLPPEARLPAP
jgi:hypothetical protein